MSKEESPVEPAKAPDKPVIEDRIDEFAIAMFASMGYTGRLPDTLVEAYAAFKLRKDAIHPGRLSPEGFVIVTMLHSMVSPPVAVAPKKAKE